jgi:hypothetical protein
LRRINALEQQIGRSIAVDFEKILDEYEDTMLKRDPEL